MSRTETHTGKIKVITMTTKDTVEYINEYLSKYWEIEMSDNGRFYVYETDAYNEEYWKKGIEFPYDVIEVKDQWWLIKFVKHKEFGEDENLEEIYLNEDGTYDFICQFYNGGTCLSEMIGYMLEKTTKQ